VPDIDALPSTPLSISSAEGVRGLRISTKLDPKMEADLQGMVDMLMAVNVRREGGRGGGREGGREGGFIQHAG